MKKVYFLILIFFNLVFNIQAQKLEIAILDLKAGVGRTQSQVDGLSDMLTVELQKSGVFTIKERTQVNQIIQELKFQKSDLSNAQIKAIGERLKVQAILIGTINFQVQERTLEDVATDMAKGEYNIDVRLVDVNNGEILSAAGGNVPGNQTERSVMQKIAQELVENLTVSTNPKSVITLYDYLYVYPEDLGKFSTEPKSFITAINKQNTYGFNDWRLPTKEELDLLNSNKRNLGMFYSAEYAYNGSWNNSAQSYSVRLVRTEVLVQQSDTKPEVNPYLEKTTYDFGTIPVLEGSVTTTFTVQNPTKETLFITNVKTTCTCLVATWTKYEIAPGESGSITVKFLTNGRQGTTFNYNLTSILSNGEKLTMNVKGKVE